MRRRSVEILALAAAACTASARDRPAFEDGSLVAINEGETVTRTLSHRPAPGAALAPWVTIAGTTLTLAPPCSLISGSDGPPHLYTFDLQNGDDPILVQVSPTLAGGCLPRVLACLTGPTISCAGPLDPITLAPFQDQSSGTLQDRTVRILFSPPSPADPEPDRELHFRLYDPDDLDGSGSPLLARLTTDAPLVFVRGDANQLFNDTAEPVASIYNAHVIGEFRVSYEIADRRSAQAVIATGAYALDWSDTRPGESPRLAIEAASCASASPLGCSVARAPSAPACLAPHARPFTLGLRVWLAPHAITGGVNAVHLAARAGNGAALPSATLTAMSQTRSDSMDLAVGSDGALPVSAELEVGADTDQTVLLRAWFCVAGNGDSQGAPRCSSLDAGGSGSAMPDATLAVRVMAPSAPQCP